MRYIFKKDIVFRHNSKTNIFDSAKRGSAAKESPHLYTSLEELVNGYSNMIKEAPLEINVYVKANEKYTNVFYVIKNNPRISSCTPDQKYVEMWKITYEIK